MTNFSTSGFYARTPAANQNNSSDAPLLYSNSTKNNKQGGGLADINNTGLPGTQGYKLPASNYASRSLPSFTGNPSLSTNMVYTPFTTSFEDTGTKPNVETNKDVSLVRLANSGLDRGANPYSRTSDLSDRIDRRFGQDDDRVYLRDNTGYFLSGPCGPLAATGGVLWPFTPVIQVNHKANYEMQHLTHTPYVTPIFQSSSVESVSVSGEFTCNNMDTAAYVAGVIHFFRSVTKMFYGKDDNPGMPPPILFLSGHGPAVFENVPVVVTSFDLNMPADVDYISCTVAGAKQRVPTLMTIGASMVPVYSRTKITEQYSLGAFARGGLLGQGFI